MPSLSTRFALSLAILCGTLTLTSLQAGAESDSRRSRSGKPASFGGQADVPGSFGHRAGAGFDTVSGGVRRSDLGFRREAIGGIAGYDVRHDHRGYRNGEGYHRHRAPDRLSLGFERRGSFVRYQGGRHWDRDDFANTGFHGNRTLTTFDVGDWNGGGSFVYYGAPPSLSPALHETGLVVQRGPKIIDVASERLDRRPIGPSGIDVVQTGGAKIIRIAPGYRMADAARKRDRVPDLAMQPWSSGWLSWCSQTYRSFDPDLGTYVARDGRIRFCQPD